MIQRCKTNEEHGFRKKEKRSLLQLIKKSNSILNEKFQQILFVSDNIFPELFLQKKNLGNDFSFFLFF